MVKFSMIKEGEKRLLVELITVKGISRGKDESYVRYEE